MYTEERQNRIYELIKQKGRVTVKELSSYFNISEVTIRSDLKRLSDLGKIVRTHGGAIFLDEQKSELPVSLRKNKQKDIKQQIGKCAADLISDGEVVFIDASTTACEMAQYLKDKHEVIIITNSLDCAYSLVTSTSLEVIMLGGIIRKESLSIVGDTISQQLSDIKISKAFFGAWGFSLKDGLTDVNPQEIQVKKIIVEKSREQIALLDSSKWDKVSYGTFLETSQLGTIITDRDAPSHILEALKKQGVKIIQVEGKA